MSTVEEKEQDYRTYIDTHRENVKKAYEKIVKKYAEEYLSPDSVDILERNIEQHDEDKDIDFIFQAYRKNHFPVDEKEKQAAEQEYKIAWDYHKKVNPHHWEFFLDDNDEEFTNPEISEEEKEIYKLAYLEMLADWLSFGFKNAQDRSGKGDGLSVTGDSLEFETWYNKNKDKIKIHPQLEEWFNPIVNEVIEYINENSKTLYEGIIRRERYHEETNTWLIQTNKGFMIINPETLTYRLDYNWEIATKCTDKEELKLLLVKLLRKYNILKAARIISIADLKRDMKENPQKYNYKQEIEMAERERIEKSIFNDSTYNQDPQQDESFTGSAVSYFNNDNKSDNEDLSIFIEKT